MFIRVRGRSMIPTLRPGDVLFVQPRPRGPFVRGALVLIRLRRPPAGLFVKRVIGLPGETVRVEQAAASVDGRALNEPYVAAAAALEPKPDGTLTAGADEYVVLGDARDDSLDSRRFGPVRRDEITGLVRFRLWPLTRWGGLA